MSEQEGLTFSFLLSHPTENVLSVCQSIFWTNNKYRSVKLKSTRFQKCIKTIPKLCMLMTWRIYNHASYRVKRLPTFPVASASSLLQHAAGRLQLVCIRKETLRLQQTHTSVGIQQQQMTESSFYPETFRVIMRLMFVPVKQSYATNPSGQTDRRWGGKRWKEEQIKNMSAASRSPLFLLSEPLCSAWAEFIRSAAGDWWWEVFGRHNQLILKVASLLHCEFCSWQDQTSSGRTLRDSRKLRTFTLKTRVRTSVSLCTESTRSKRQCTAYIILMGFANMNYVNCFFLSSFQQE